MHISYDAKRVLRNATGLGNHGRGLLLALARARPDWRFTLYGSGKGPNLFAHALAEHPNLRLAPPSGVWAKLPVSMWRSLGLSRRIARDKPDIHHGLSHELPLGIRSTGVRSVVTMHDMLPFLHPELFPRLDRVVYRRKFRHACGQAHRIVAVSQSTREDIVRFLNPPAPIDVVYQGCDPIFHVTVADNDLRALRDRHRLPERYILSVGALTERKNIHTLIRAFASLAQNPALKDTALAIAGSGREYAARLKDLVRELNLEHRVRFLGRVEQKDLPGLYQGAAVFCYPSLYEGFGIPILEALNSGTPVVTSQGSCFSEAGGPGSIYIDPSRPDDLAQALRTVLTDPDMAREMARRGREHARLFSDDRIVADMVRVYTSVLDSS